MFSVSRFIEKSAILYSEVQNSRSKLFRCGNLGIKISEITRLTRNTCTTSISGLSICCHICTGMRQEPRNFRAIPTSYCFRSFED